jgi:hypothetical protein
MIRAEYRSTSHTLSRKLTNASVTSTAAVVSAMMRMKLTAFTWAPVSSAMARSERRARESVARSATSARLVTPIAASTAAMSPPNATSTKAAPMKSQGCMVSDVAPAS